MSKEPRGITADGREITADDEWFDNLLRQYEHRGVDIDLIYMARPLFEGVPVQQRTVERIFERTLSGHLSAEDAQVRLLGLLRSQGMRPGAIARHGDSEFDETWDGMSGRPARNGLADYTLVTSKEAQRNGVAQGGYPSGAGAPTKQPSGRQHDHIAHFGE